MLKNKGNVKDVEVVENQTLTFPREMLTMLKMLKFWGKFGGLLRGNPHENFNIFSVSPVLSTFLEKGA